MTTKIPTVKDLSALLRDLKRDIEDDYRCQGFEAADYDGGRKIGGLPGLPCMTVTIGWSDETGKWDYQTGDNSYTGGAYCYPHWAVVDLYRRSDSRALARDIRSQLVDLVSWR